LWAAKNPLWKPAAVVAALMAFSRLYLYVHWPTDIVGGIVVGWLCGWLGAKIVAWGKGMLQKRKNA
jgi:undecaprenyl-diphosphatase